MRIHVLCLLSVLCAGAIIVGSSGFAAAQTRNFTISDGSSTLGLLRVAARNAKTLPASTMRAGDSTLIVVYRGALQNFVTCTLGNTNVSRDLKLDFRSTMESQGPRLTTTTVYLVTDAANPPLSLVFSSLDEGKAGNLSCHATGAMERKLLGVK